MEAIEQAHQQECEAKNQEQFRIRQLSLKKHSSTPKQLSWDEQHSWGVKARKPVKASAALSSKIHPGLYQKGRKTSSKPIQGRKKRPSGRKALTPDGPTVRQRKTTRLL